MLGRGKFLCPLRLTKFGGLKASVRGLKLECPWVEIGLSGGRNRKDLGGMYWIRRHLLLQTTRTSKGVKKQPFSLHRQ